MFNGKPEIRRSSDDMVMTEWEDEKLLTLKGTSVRGQNLAYLSHHHEGR